MQHSWKKTSRNGLDVKKSYSHTESIESFLCLTHTNTVRVNSSKTDFELIESAINGNEMSFAEIVRRHQSIVASTAMNMLGDMEEAKEVGQMVFVRFYKSMAKFQNKAKLSTYLTRITINLCLNNLKRRQNFSSRTNSLDIAYGVSTGDKLTDYENKEIINKALQMLDENHRAIVTVRMIQGYDTLQTAEILGIPKGTVLSRLKRAMDKLKIILINDFNYEYT